MTKQIMLEYVRKLKTPSRELRKNSTVAESMLWSCINNKQILGVKFYRQKPILNYIVDFYAHKPKLVIECDGSQHYEEEHAQADKLRDEELFRLEILVLRFDNYQVTHHLLSVVEEIWQHVNQRI